MLFEDRRAYSLQRQAVIVASPELRERELIKLATLGDRARRCAAGARGRRAGGEPDRRGGIAVFRVAFERWVEPANERSIQELIHDSLDQLSLLTAGREITRA